MKEYKGIILMLICSLLLTLGCAPKVPPNFEDMKLEIMPKIVAQNNDGYSIKVVIKNQSKTYRFFSSSVYIGIHKGSPDHQELTSAAYLVEAIPTLEGDSNTFVYNIKLPMRLLDIEPGVDKKSVDVIARGAWLSSMDKFVADANQSVQFYLSSTGHE